MSTIEILVMTSYPPRKCGIATYSQDLIHALLNKYNEDFTIKVCTLEDENQQFSYSSPVTFCLKTWIPQDYIRLAREINVNMNIRLIYLQHEFGLFHGSYGNHIIYFLKEIKAKVITTFHTVLANPDLELLEVVTLIARYSQCIIVMTKSAALILKKDYLIDEDKIQVIAHGIHLIKPPGAINRTNLPFPDKIILATFGLISEGKSIETALLALPRIIKKFPNVLYLIIGKTHPQVLLREGEKYRDSLKQNVQELDLQKHVLFINKFLSLEVLLEYLQRTDIYLFTSKDRTQTVSGTLTYALAAGCPVVCTPIPHAVELTENSGIHFDFQNPVKLAAAVLKLLVDPVLAGNMSLNALHKTSAMAWQNSAIAHLDIARKNLAAFDFNPELKLPGISLNHLRRMTTSFGIIQFAHIAEPDLDSGYTLDDNARALIVLSNNFKLTGNFGDLFLINIYIEFILFCLQEDGTFLNYVTREHQFFEKNRSENLEDANGRAIWALGEFLSLKHIISSHIQIEVEQVLQDIHPMIRKLQSPRAIAFAIKGLCCFYQFRKQPETLALIEELAAILATKYQEQASENWYWFEPYLTYANALLPEAMLLAAKCTQNSDYRFIAVKSFDFLLSVTHSTEPISMISNTGKYCKGQIKKPYGQQPIEYAYTILALDAFYEEFGHEHYFKKLLTTFNWFLGENHLKQIIYNPCSGGCYDGLEKDQVNLNQGAESTISYLLARLTIEKYNHSRVMDNQLPV